MIDKVFGYKGLLRFEDAVSHVSRDFASFKSFLSDFDRGNIV